MDLSQKDTDSSSSAPALILRPGDLPPEVERLKEASASGNLADAKDIFSQWLAMPTSQRIEIGSFVAALTAAVENSHVHVASYLLSQGVPGLASLFVTAIEARSYEMLQTFLDHGWDINEPIKMGCPPPLM